MRKREPIKVKNEKKVKNRVKMRKREPTKHKMKAVNDRSQVFRMRVFCCLKTGISKKLVRNFFKRFVWL